MMHDKNRQEQDIVAAINWAATRNQRTMAGRIYANYKVAIETRSCHEVV